MQFRFPGQILNGFLGKFLPIIISILAVFSQARAEVYDFTAPKSKPKLLLKFSPNISPEQRDEALKNAVSSRSLNSGVQRQQNGDTQVQAIALAPGVDTSSELARLSKLPGVAYAEPNYRIQISALGTPVIPNDFNFSNMYALRNTGLGGAKTNADIHATAAWVLSTGSSNVLIAVIDTGVDYFHEDLRDNLWRNPGEIPGNGIDDDGNGYVDDVYGYDFVSGDSDPFDDNNHGTHVSGTIGAVGNNGVGTVGVCWRVSLMECKAFDETGNGSVADAIQAIQYAVANGARIINASWGLEEKSRALEDAVQEAINAGILFVAAAGNNRTDTPSYPAAFKSVVAVAATDEKDNRAIFSNYGNWISVSAPGLNILSTLPENNYGIESGTSMAAPHVTGVAGLILSRFPEYNGDELRQVLINSVDPIFSDKPMGNGRINAALAVQMDQPLPYSILNLSDETFGLVDIIGSAYGRFFTGYTVRAASRNTPNSWVQIASSTQPVTNSTLGRFNSSLLPDGQTVVQLIVTNQNGSTALFTRDTKISNTAITAPLSGDVLAPGVYPVRGNVFAEEGTYELAYAAGLDPKQWITIQTGEIQTIQNGFWGEWNAANLTNGYYSLRLVITTGSRKAETVAPGIYIESELKPGWPIHLPTDADFPSTEWRNIRAADLDGDGLSEFIIIDPATLEHPQTLLVYSIHGELLWSRVLGFDLTPDIPAIGDLDGDGKLEIVVDGPAGFLAFHSDGTEMASGWPIASSTSNHAKVLADVDADGTPELITYSQENPVAVAPEFRELAVYKCDGSLVRKWNLAVSGFTNQVQKIFPAVADIDGQPGLEIVAVSGSFEVQAFDYRQDQPIWRASTRGAILTSPVIGDVDGNGSPDIIVATAAENGATEGGVYIFDHHGTLWPGWPMLDDQSFLISPALGDLDKDGRLEIVLPSSAPERMHVLQWDGFEADGWPQDIFPKSNPRAGITIANLDNDPESEILMVAPGYPLLSVLLNDLSYSGGISAWKYNGQKLSLPATGPIDSLPIEITPTPEWHKAAPGTIGDFDGDGLLDFVATSLQEITLGDDIAFKDRSSLYVWNVGVPVPVDPAIDPFAQIEWPMFAHDLGNSGAYSLPLNPNSGFKDKTVAIRDRHICDEDQILLLHPLTNDLNATSQPLELVSFTQPPHGSAYRTGLNNIAYIPTNDFRGFDSFDYTIRDVLGNTSTGSIKLLVKAINDPPTAEAMEFTIPKNSSANVIFQGNDPDGDKINFRVITGPAHGELWNYPNVATYYPTKGYSGTDSF
ncbi:MAG: S8 family serine peptidase, partial [Verrucomicrobiota bacterium]